MDEMTMAEKIKYLRAMHNLTLEEVGNAVGVGKSTVRKWENGIIANMRRDKIAALAEVLHTTPAYLMGWNEDEPEILMTKEEALEAAFSDRPEMRALFSVAEDCTAEEIEQAIKIIEALKK